MDQEPLRRDRAWTRPEQATAPKWPGMSIRFFAMGFAALLLLSALYAGGDYASSVYRSFTSKAPAEFDPRPAPRPPSSGDSSNGSGMISIQRVPPETGSPEPVARQLEQLQPSSGSPSHAPASVSTTEAAKIHTKGQQRLAVKSGQSALKAVEEWIAEAMLWQKEVEPLNKSDAGRRIAADLALVDQYQAVINEERPDTDVATELRQVISELLEPLQQAADNKDDLSVTPDGINESFANYRAQAVAARDALRKLRNQVNAIRERAKDLEPASVTLDKALADRQVELASLEAESRTKELTKDREEAKRKRIEAEREAMRIQAEQDAAAIVAKAEKDKLIARAKAPEVRRLLAPFISPGYMQYRGGFVRDAVEGPMSYKGILDSGALNQTTIGLTRLYTLAADPRGLAIGNDRPGLWNYVGYPEGWSKSDQDYMRRVQDLLRELGPTLVELNMLAP